MLVSVDAKLAKLFAHELTQEQALSLAEQAKGHDAKEILFAIQCFSEAQGKIKSAFIPQLPLEMAIIKAVQGPQAQAAPTNVAQSAAPIAPKPVQNVAPSQAAAPIPQAPKTQFMAPAPTPIQPSEETPFTAPQAPEMPHEAAPAPESVQEAPQENVAQTSEKAPAATGAPVSINEVKKHWLQAVSEMKQLNHSLAAVLQSCQAVNTEANILTIATKFSFHKDKLNEHANKLTMEGVFAKILGLQLRINVITAQEAGITIASSLTTPNAGHSETAPSETSSLLSDAANIMGGNIVQ
jgi:DNA polymerase III gamma/tau subunit